MISGELFQSLAQIGLYDELTDLIVNQTKSLPQNIVKISDLPVEKISEYNVIYVYTQCLDSFFEKFYLSLNENTIIISHNSDIGVTEKYLKYLQGNKIKAWFCQNREVFHKKLFSIPIGLANSQWDHGNQQLIRQIRNELNKKEILVYKNFDINTNYGERYQCHNITHTNGIPLSHKISIADYWRTLSKSVFVISPPGNGIDCHRIWEALYLRTVPVVRYHEAFSQFTHLPILFVKDWESVTINFLRSKIELYITNPNIFDIPLLEIEFWSKHILNYGNN